MAYVDSQLEFSDAQVFTATAISTNVYDVLAMQKGGGANISPNGRVDLGNDINSAWLIVSVNTAFAGGTSLAVTLETADDAGLTTNATVIATSGTVVLAGLTKGTSLIAVQLPAVLLRRYIGMRYTVVGTMSGGGSVDAYITLNPSINRIYKSGFVVQ